MIRLNSISPFYLTSLLDKKKLFLDRARVLNITSLAASQYFPTMGMYCISKAALNMATQI